MYWMLSNLFMCRENLAYAYNTRKEQNREKASIASMAMDLRDRAIIIIPASELGDPRIPLAEDGFFFLIIRVDDGRANLNGKRQKPKTCAELIESMPANAVNSRPYKLGSVLPFDVWIKILLLLASDCEMDRVRSVKSVSVIARDICNASRASKELWSASQIALENLGSQCSLQTQQHGTSLGNTIKPSWSEFVAQPLMSSTEELQDILQACTPFHPSCLRCSSYTEKNALILRILNFLLLTKPSSVPFQLLYAVAQERNNCRVAHTGVFANWFKRERPDHPALSFSDLKFRRILTCMGIRTSEDFDEATSTLMQRYELYDQLAILSNEEYMDRRQHIVILPQV